MPGRSATCSLPTTSGTLSRSGRAPGCCTTSAARTGLTGRGPAAGRVAVPAAGPGGGPGRGEQGDLSVTGSRPLGGTHALDQMWRRLRLDQADGRALARRAQAGPGDRADPVRPRGEPRLAASSKLAAAEWVREDVHVDGLGETTDDACYRAMDQLLESSRTWPSRRTTRSPTSSTLRWTCCSSTRHPRISRRKRQTGTFRAMRTASASRPAARRRSPRTGSGRTGNPRIP